MGDLKVIRNDGDIYLERLKSLVELYESYHCTDPDSAIAAYLYFKACELYSLHDAFFTDEEDEEGGPGRSP